MPRFMLAFIVSAFAWSIAWAEAPKPAPKVEVEADTFAELIQKLHTQKVKFLNSLKDNPIRTLKEQLEKQFEITFVVREDLFKLQDQGDGEIMDRKFKLDTNLSGIPLEASCDWPSKTSKRRSWCASTTSKSPPGKRRSPSPTILPTPFCTTRVRRKQSRRRSEISSAIRRW